MANIVKTDKPHEYEINEKLDAPKKFGDLVTSGSVSGLKRNSTSEARRGDATALVASEKATGWITSYASKRKSAEDMLAQTTTPKVRRGPNGGTHMGRLSYTLYAAHLESGMIRPTRVALKQMVR